MHVEKTIAVADCETDPFRSGFPVMPFAWGFYDGSSYVTFWGDECTNQFLAHIAAIETPMIIYGHNAGKFDWLFLSKHFRNDVQVIGSRIVKAFIGIHEFRDSFANIPVPLSQFLSLDKKMKGEIDYDIMSRDKRNKPANRDKILAYLKDDCLVLHDGITKYREMFGNSLTMAGASMKNLNLVCTKQKGQRIYEQLTPLQDQFIRPFYYGGRVECFASGLHYGDFSLYDVTSMYPYTMREYMHPISATFKYREGSQAHITDETDFAEIVAYSYGALPLRDKIGLRFPHGRHTFQATGAEIRQALTLGMLKIIKVNYTITASERICFKTFIEQFFNLRIQAGIEGDKMLALFFKLVMNSAYGKFAMNPRDFQEIIALDEGETPHEGPLWFDDEIRAARKATHRHELRCACDQCKLANSAWEIAAACQKTVMWKRVARDTDGKFLNVATAASITGYSRAVLLEGLARAECAFYCDTDSIICTGSFAGRTGNALGQWKLETQGHTLAVAGKKQYALWGERATGDGADKINAHRIKAYGDDTCVKLASKGVRLKAADILDVATNRATHLVNGKPVAGLLYTQDAPVFGLLGEQQKLSRVIKNTALVERTDA